MQEIDTALVMKALEPIWTTKTETASRVRGRIESVLNWATTRKFRQGENPARWRGHLDNLLPQKGKVQKVEHHPALPYAEMGAFMAALRNQQGIAALALEFAILTAARTGEVIGARWEEIDMSSAVWTVPAERMKAGKEHRVPLVTRAVAIIQSMQGMGGDFIFPGGKKDKPQSNMAMLALLKRMDRIDISVHGFRSSFRDWADDCTDYPHEVKEMAIAHTIKNKAEAAYRRGDLLEKRRGLMDEWEAYCNSIPSIGK